MYELKTDLTLFPITAHLRVFKQNKIITVMKQWKQIKKVQTNHNLVLLPILPILNT